TALSALPDRALGCGLSCRATVVRRSTPRARRQSRPSTPAERRVGAPGNCGTWLVTLAGHGRGSRASSGRLLLRGRRLLDATTSAGVGRPVADSAIAVGIGFQADWRDAAAGHARQ